MSQPGKALYTKLSMLLNSNHIIYVLDLVAQSCLMLCDPMDCSLPSTSVHGDSPRENTPVNGLPCPPPGNLPNLGIKPRFAALQADSLPAELEGRPKNTRMGSLALFQWIFPTQESKQGLLHCRQILYQLSSQGSLHKSTILQFLKMAGIGHIVLLRN